MLSVHLNPDLRPSLRRTDVQGYQDSIVTDGIYDRGAGGVRQDTRCGTSAAEHAR